MAREDKVLTIINIHQIDLAVQYVDRLIGLAQGVIVFDGPPTQFNQAAHDRTYNFDRVHI